MYTYHPLYKQHLPLYRPDPLHKQDPLHKFQYEAHKQYQHGLVAVPLDASGRAPVTDMAISAVRVVGALAAEIDPRKLSR
jgi:hypothetical protein